MPFVKNPEIPLVEVKHEKEEKREEEELTCDGEKHEEDNQLDGIMSNVFVFFCVYINKVNQTLFIGRCKIYNTIIIIYTYILYEI